jgi:hypothetical protein
MTIARPLLWNGKFAARISRPPSSNGHGSNPSSNAPGSSNGSSAPGNSNGKGPQQ